MESYEIILDAFLKVKGFFCSFVFLTYEADVQGAS